MLRIECVILYGINYTCIHVYFFVFKAETLILFCRVFHRAWTFTSISDFIQSCWGIHKCVVCSLKDSRTMQSRLVKGGRERHDFVRSSHCDRSNDVVVDRFRLNCCADRGLEWMNKTMKIRPPLSVFWAEDNIVISFVQFDSSSYRMYLVFTQCGQHKFTCQFQASEFHWVCCILQLAARCGRASSRD